MARELQVFLIWENGRREEKRILEDIKSKYELLKIFEIEWPRSSFPNSFKRFYSKNLRSGWRKACETGRGKFLLIAAYDSNPHYVLNPRRGYEINDNAIRNKNLYRQWTPGGFLVHGSDNLAEVDENLLLTLGLNREEFEKKYTAADENITQISRPMPGYKSWKDTEELFNFAHKIKEIKKLRIHNNILEIHCSNPSVARRFLNLRQPWFGLFSKKYYTIVNNKRLNVVLQD